MNDTVISNYAFYHGIGADLGLSDPVFPKRLKEAGFDPEAKVAQTLNLPKQYNLN
jgi:hypothetical protein